MFYTIQHCQNYSGPEKYLDTYKYHSIRNSKLWCILIYYNDKLTLKCTNMFWDHCLFIEWDTKTCRHTMNLSHCPCSKLSDLLSSFISSLLPFSPYTCRKTCASVPEPLISDVQTHRDQGNSVKHTNTQKRWICVSWWIKNQFNNIFMIIILSLI